MQSVDRFLPAIAIETSRRPGSVALALEPETALLTPLPTGTDQAGGLLPTLSGLLDANGLEPDALRLIVLGLGPGSFTGLRVGAAVAATLSHFLPAPLVARPSLEGSPLLLESGLAALCLDALRGQVHGALYLDGKELLPASLLVPAAFADLLARHGQGGLIGGDGIVVLDAQVVRPSGWRDFGPGWEPRADLLLKSGLRHALQGEMTQTSGLEPLYLRPAAAEEIRSARSRRP